MFQRSFVHSYTYHTETTYYFIYFTYFKYWNLWLGSAPRFFCFAIFQINLWFSLWNKHHVSVAPMFLQLQIDPSYVTVGGASSQGRGERNTIAFQLLWLLTAQPITIMYASHILCTVNYKLYLVLGTLPIFLFFYFLIIVTTSLKTGFKQ